MDIDGQRAKNGHEEQDGNKPDLDGRLCTGVDMWTFVKRSQKLTYESTQWLDYGAI